MSCVLLRFMQCYNSPKSCDSIMCLHYYLIFFFPGDESRQKFNIATWTIMNHIKFRNHSLCVCHNKRHIIIPMVQQRSLEIFIHRSFLTNNNRPSGGERKLGVLPSLKLYISPNIPHECDNEKKGILLFKN